jgi:hypothetical protein
MYDREINLDLTARIGVTKEVYQLLRQERRKQKISMAKIICNLILEKYGNQERL